MRKILAVKKGPRVYQLIGGRLRVDPQQPPTVKLFEQVSSQPVIIDAHLKNGLLIRICNPDFITFSKEIKEKL